MGSASGGVRLRPGDVALCAAVLIVAGVCALYLHTRPKGLEVEVWADGALYLRAALWADGEYPIQTREGLNILQVQSGRARIRYADCDAGYCVRAGWIEKSGEGLVCLPHRVAIRVLGGGLDALTA